MTTNATTPTAEEIQAELAEAQAEAAAAQPPPPAPPVVKVAPPPPPPPPPLPANLKPLKMPFNHPVTEQTVAYSDGTHCWAATGFYIGVLPPPAAPAPAVPAPAEPAAE
jgi:hypothetical protein